MAALFWIIGFANDQQAMRAVSFYRDFNAVRDIPKKVGMPYEEAAAGHFSAERCAEKARAGEKRKIEKGKAVAGVARLYDDWLYVGRRLDALRRL